MLLSCGDVTTSAELSVSATDAVNEYLKVLEDFV